MRNILAAIIASFAFSQANAVAFDAHSAFVDDQINAAIQAALAGSHYESTRSTSPTAPSEASVLTSAPAIPAAPRLIDATDAYAAPNSTIGMWRSTPGQWIDADLPLWGDHPDWLMVDPGVAPERPGVVYFFSGTMSAGTPTTSPALAQVSVPEPGTLALLLPALLLVRTRRQRRDA